MKNLTIGKEFDNKKLSVYLQHQFDGLGLNTIYKALRKKDIIVNEKRINSNIILHQNDNVIIYIPDELLYRQFDIEIIYEDDNIVVVNKPIGIEVVGKNPDKKDLTKYMNGNTPCHRLDMNTSGLVLFAKNEEALEILLKKFKTQEIEKHYLATVYGIPKKQQDIITSYLFKDSKKNMVYISDEPKKGYQKIVTSYSVVSKNTQNNTSVLDVELHTGRTHQIRAHLAHIGLPIIGDR